MNVEAEAVVEAGEVLGNQDPVDASTNEGVQIEGEAAPAGSKFETTARDNGWVPKTEWQGDPDDWVDAKEYVRRGELFSKIDHQRSEIRDLKKAIGALQEHHTKVKESEYQRALEYLKQQKKTALEEGDADRLLATDDAIDILKQERQQEQVVAQQQQKAGPTPYFQSWVAKNNWYLNDPELRSFADDIGVGAYQRAKGQIAEEELYELVRNRVLKAYPEKFRGNAPKTSAVEGAGGTSHAVKPDSFKLSEEETKAMNTFVRQGIMTKQQYIDEIKRTR